MKISAVNFYSARSTDQNGQTKAKNPSFGQSQRRLPSDKDFWVPDDIMPVWDEERGQYVNFSRSKAIEELKQMGAINDNSSPQYVDFALKVYRDYLTGRF